MRIAIPQGRYEVRVSGPGDGSNIQRLVWNERLAMIEIAYPSGTVSRHIDHPDYSSYSTTGIPEPTADFAAPEPNHLAYRTELRAREWTTPLGRCILPFRESTGPDGARECVAGPEDAPDVIYTYEGRLDAAGGQVLPLKAIRRDAARKIVQTFEFLSADLASPVLDSDIIPDWYRSEVHICDSRAGSNLGWTYEEIRAATGKASGVTPEDLLVLSQARMEEWEACDRKVRRAFLVAGVAVVAVGALVVRRLRA